MAFVLAGPSRNRIAVVALGAALLAGCGSDEPEQAAPAPPPPATTEAAAPTVTTGHLAAGRNALSFEAEDGTTIDYTLVLPDGFDTDAEYPVLLALPPGGQGQAEVDAGLDRYWEAEARERGWVVVSPVAPDGRLFFDGSEDYIPELLDAVDDQGVRPEAGEYHVAGVSNGGLSAFRIALEYPTDFRTVLAVPGYPLPEDESRLDRLIGHRVWMVVGELDGEWRAAAEQARERLKSLRVDATVTVAAGDGHIIDNYGGADFFDFLDASRP